MAIYGKIPNITRSGRCPHPVRRPHAAAHVHAVGRSQRDTRPNSFAAADLPLTR